MGRRVSSCAGLVWAMGLLVAVYVPPWLCTASWDRRRLGLASGWLGESSTAVCWLAVSRVGFRRWEVLLAAAAVTSFAAGDTYYAW